MNRRRLFQVGLNTYSIRCLSLGIANFLCADFWDAVRLLVLVLVLVLEPRQSCSIETVFKPP